jgi:hypothetical protein
MSTGTETGEGSPPNPQTTLLDSRDGADLPRSRDLVGDPRVTKAGPFTMQIEWVKVRRPSG